MSKRDLKKTKGVWLPKTSAAQATGLEKHFVEYANYFVYSERYSNPHWFIPIHLMLDKFQDAYSVRSILLKDSPEPFKIMEASYKTATTDSKIIEELRKTEDILEDDGNPKDVEDILGDVSGIEEMSVLNEQLLKARLQNIEARTKSTLENLNETKKSLFREWTEKFFEVFTTSFAKFKNELVLLRLNDEKLQKLQELLSKSIETMEDNLKYLEAGYLESNEEEDVEK